MPILFDRSNVSLDKHRAKLFRRRSSCRFYTRQACCDALSHRLSSVWIELTQTTLEDFMGAPVVHFEIMGGKGNQLETFYGQLFGWTINRNNPMKYGVVDTGGGPGGINGGVGTSQDGNKRVSVYVRVDDLHATLNKVEKL